MAIDVSNRDWGRYDKETVTFYRRVAELLPANWSLADPTLGEVEYDNELFNYVAHNRCGASLFHRRGKEFLVGTKTIAVAFDTLEAAISYAEMIA